MTEKMTKNGWYTSGQTTARQLPEFLQDLAVDTSRRGSALQRREFIALASTMGASAATAYGMLGLAAPPRAHAQTQPGGTLRVAMTIPYIDDPRFFSANHMGNVARQFCENLVRWERDFSLSPYLLEGWEVNEDATEYILRLRRGVTWNHGKRFHAEDVVYNYTRWCERDAEDNSVATRMSALIDESSGKAKTGAITKLDDYTVRLRLNRADVSLIASAVDYTTLLVYRDFDKKGGDLAQRPIGTGPFELVSLEVNARAEVRRRADNKWWKGTPPLDGVVWTDYGLDPESEIAAWEADDIDLNYETSGNTITALDALGLRKSETITATTYVVRMNLDNYPYDNPQLRKAVQLAVDNNILLRIGYHNRGELAENHHVGPMHPEYFELPRQRANLRKARRYLRQAGQRFHQFNLISLDKDDPRNAANSVAAQMRKAGMNVKRTVLPEEKFWSNWSAYPFSLTEWNGRPLGVQVLALAYRSGEPWNETAYSNPRFDALLDQALSTPKADQRRELMASLEKMIQDASIIIQPFWRSLCSHANPRVKNYAMHQTFEQQFDDTYLEA